MLRYIIILMTILALSLGFTACKHDNYGPVGVHSVYVVDTSNPDGPIFELTLGNFGEETVISLSASFNPWINAKDNSINGENRGQFRFEFTEVTPSNPLLPGESISKTLTIPGAPKHYDKDYQVIVIVSGTLQNGDHFGCPLLKKIIQDNS